MYRTKQQRETTIYMQQVLTSQRVMRHAAWGMKKSLTAQLHAMEKQDVAVQGLVEKKGHIIYSNK